jgi:hypothetical protein
LVPTFRDLGGRIGLADGLSADSDSATMGAQMTSCVRFVRDALSDRRLFRLAHTSISTSGYRSTTETADSGSLRNCGDLGGMPTDHMSHPHGNQVILDAALRILRKGH